MVIYLYSDFMGISLPFVTNAVKCFSQEYGKNSGNFFKDVLGCPQLENGYISISHTHNYIAIAIADSRVGIDIEMSDRKINLKNFTPKLWTEVESYAKYLGTGLSSKLINTPPPKELLSTLQIDNLIITACSYDKIVIFHDMRQ